MHQDYRPVSAYAVTAFVCAMMCLTSVITLVGLWFAVPSMLLAAAAFWQGRSCRVAGMLFARTAVFVSLTLTVVIPVRFYLHYLSEAPDGYERVNFESLIRSDSLAEYEGKQICLKGFAIVTEWPVAPDSEVLLSCDGNRLKSEDAVTVRVTRHYDPDLLPGPIAISGTLVKFKQFDSDTSGYLLINSRIRPAVTFVDLAPRCMLEGC